MSDKTMWTAYYDQEYGVIKIKPFRVSDAINNKIMSIGADKNEVIMNLRTRMKQGAARLKMVAATIEAASNEPVEGGGGGSETNNPGVRPSD